MRRVAGSACVLCDPSSTPPDGWKHTGVRVVLGDQLDDSSTPQTPGMHRAVAIDRARRGAQKLWAGTVHVHANAKTGAHHHGPLESVIYVVSGRARMRWGEALEFTAAAGPGDFIYVPPFVPPPPVGEELGLSRVDQDHFGVLEGADGEPALTCDRGTVAGVQPHAVD